MFSMLIPLILGCPEPVDFSDRSVDNSNNSTDASQVEAPAFQTTTGAPVPTDAMVENSEGAPPSMGTFAADLPESEVRARFTQKELEDGATIRGTANCVDCTGQILVRALPPPPEDPGLQASGEGMQLITQVVLEGTGNFSLKVPDQSPVVLQIVDDANKDGIPSQGERMGMRKEGAVFADGVVENISLMVGVFPKKDPIEGLGVIPTPPLPGEEGAGAIEGDMVPSPTNAQGTPEMNEGNPPGNMPTPEGTPEMNEGTPPAGDMPTPEGKPPEGSPPQNPIPTGEGSGPPQDE
jgi:hypothetical protein